MPRPQTRDVTFSIDGREVTAPENAMLVDAAKYGDVEIPVFCYEPKLGQPVGACRMCLVEIEGIPKLQTACSTPVKDGMVVHTQTDRVHDAQRAVVEFLLVNHPLDCPVCDKGGECPLQDITYGWGPGTSRFIEPKRHFKKPLELSPLVAIDRERCILCYRCVRFSQEVSEDYQLILLERGAHSFVGTFDGHPYVAPFSGNIVELCPVGALTSSAYRFRARPWDIEGAGSVCTLCPAQCNVEFTVRDDRVMRVLARDNPDVDDGWLCDKGRFAYQSVHIDERITQPLVREGTNLHAGELGEGARARRQPALKKAGAKAAALAGGETTNEEAFLLAQLFRDGLGSGHLASRAGGELPLDVERALANPALQATVPDLEFAHTVVLVECDPVDDAPILDLRIRKGVRRHDVRARRSPARARPRSTPAPTSVRPHRRRAAARRCSCARGRRTTSSSTRHHRGRRGHRDRLRRAAARRAGRRDRGTRAAQPRARLGLAGRPGAGPARDPLDRPTARGLREAGFAPGHGPGFATLAEPGQGAAEIAAGLAERRPLGALPAARRPAAHAPGPRAVEGRARHRAGRDRPRVGDDRDDPRVRRRRLPGRGVRREGGHAHAPRRPPAAPAHRDRPPAAVRPGHRRAPGLAGHRRRRGPGRPRLGIAAGPIASRRMFEAIPFYAGLTLDEIGGQGVRWQERDAASSFDGAGLGAGDAEGAARRARRPRARCGSAPTARCGARRRSTSRRRCASCARSRWSSCRPSDAKRLGIADGDRVEVGSNGTRVRGAVRLRDAIPRGSVFLADAGRRQRAHRGARWRSPRIGPRPPGRRPRRPLTAHAEPAAAGAEMPPSAPLAIPPTGSSQSGHDA